MRTEKYDAKHLNSKILNSMICQMQEAPTIWVLKNKDDLELISSFCFLSAPNFVRSLADGDFVYFFFREPAVEYINCGKVSHPAM